MILYLSEEPDNAPLEFTAVAQKLIWKTLSNKDLHRLFYNFREFTSFHLVYLNCCYHLKQPASLKLLNWLNGCQAEKQVEQTSTTLPKCDQHFAVSLFIHRCGRPGGFARRNPIFIHTLNLVRCVTAAMPEYPKPGFAGQKGKEEPGNQER